MRQERTPDHLTDLLCAGDPAAGDPGLGRAERTSMRRRVQAAARERRKRPGAWLVPATAVMALLALALGLALRQPRTAHPGSVAERPLAGSAVEASGQQIQFTTDNGTLVVWVLQPRSIS